MSFHGDNSPNVKSPLSVTQATRGLGVLVFTLSLLLIAFAGLFPFDFGRSSGSVLGQIAQGFDWRWNPPDPGYVDRIENLLFFFPLGFGFTAILPRRRRPSKIALVGSIALAAILSTTIEVLQTFISFRDPSFADIWCNTLGAFAGGISFYMGGDKLIQWISGSWVWPGIVWMMLVAWAAMIPGVLAWAPGSGDLSRWDPTLPLNIGNERTGDRPWRGTVSNLFLCDRAATPEQVWQLSCGVPLPGEMENFIPGPQVWPTTSMSIAPAIHKIAQTSQFTLAATITSLSPAQTGPARIISISSDTGSGRNLTLAQDGAGLVLRIRADRRIWPEFFLENILIDSLPHPIAVTAQAGRVIVFVDGRERGRVEVSTEAQLLWKLYPHNARIRMDRYQPAIFAIFFRILVLALFAAMLYALMAAGHRSLRTRWLVMTTAIAVMAILLELGRLIPLRFT